MEILNRQRQAFQGARLARCIALLRRSRLLEGALEKRIGKGIEAGIHFFATGDDGAHQLDRRQRLGTEPGQRLSRTHIAKIKITHRTVSPKSPRTLLFHAGKICVIFRVHGKRSEEDGG